MYFSTRGSHIYRLAFKDFQNSKKIFPQIFARDMVEKWPKKPKLEVILAIWRTIEMSFGLKEAHGLLKRN